MPEEPDLTPEDSPPGLPRPVPPQSLTRRLSEIVDTVGVEPWKIGLAAIALVVTFLVAMSLARPSTGGSAEVVLPRANAAVGPASATSLVATAVVVHAAGAVVSPGIYKLPTGSRVSDLIAAAGGAAPDADLNRINLAALLADGTQVYVLRDGESAPPASASSSTGGGKGVAPEIIDLNSATVDQLDALPGVGPSTAQSIVDYRTEHGRFRSVDDLLEVRGIGPAKLEGIRKRVRV